MRPESYEKYDRAKARVAAGENIDAAVKAETMGRATYDQIKKERGDANPNPGKKWARRTKVAPMIIPLARQAPASNGKIAVIVCETSTLKDVLAGLL